MVAPTAPTKEHAIAPYGQPLQGTKLKRTLLVLVGFGRFHWAPVRFSTLWPYFRVSVSVAVFLSTELLVRAYLGGFCCTSGPDRPNPSERWGRWGPYGSLSSVALGGPWGLSGPDRPNPSERWGR